MTIVFHILCLMQMQASAIMNPTDTVDQLSMKNRILLEKQSHDYFEINWNAWREKVLEAKEDLAPFPNIERQEYRSILDLGPACIPWLLREQDFVVQMTFHVLSRTDISVLRNLPDSQSADGFKQWWAAAVLNAATEFSARRSAFDNETQSHKDYDDLSILRERKEWKRLEALGCLGLPSIMRRVKEGTADHYDYLLLTWWTLPIAFSNGPYIPYQLERLKPADRQPLPPAKEDRAYWLNWWEKNKAQYWWLLSKEELASIKFTELPSPSPSPTTSP